MGTVDCLFGQRETSAEKEVGKAAERGHSRALGKFAGVLGVLGVLALLLLPGREAQAQPTVIATISFGTSGAGPIGVNPLTNRVYAAQNGVPDIAVIDGATNTIVATVPTLGFHTGIAVNPVTNRIYVAQQFASRVRIIDGATNAFTDLPVPCGTIGVLAINAATNRLYVSCPDNNEVAVFDAGTNTFQTAIPLGLRPGFISVDPSTNRIYITNVAGNQVIVIDGASNSIVATVPVGNQPSEVAINPITNRIYVSNSADNTVSVIDGATNSVSSPPIPVGMHPLGIGVNPLTNRVYVVNFGSNNVSVIDGNTNTVVATVGVGAFPTAMAVNPVTNRIYVINNDATVSVIEDLPNRTPVANAGASQMVECASHSGTTVTLDGSASRDPDGDTLTFQWTDAGNNVIGNTALVNVTAPLGANTYTLKVTDPGGLSSTATTNVTVKDTTPPVLTLSTSNIVVTLPTASAAGATISLAGIASASDICDPSPTITNNAPAVFPIGTTTVTFTATDHSGNSSQQQLTVQVVYNFIGYFTPLLNNGQAAFKAGRTIPVKFQLTATDGTIVSNAIANIQVFQVLSTPSGTVDMTVDTFASGSSNSGTLFRFDPTSGQYIYNLSTQGYAAGTYLVRTTLNDGTTHDVQFSLK